jgi:oligopeptide transport system ATP-binding protein
LDIDQYKRELVYKNKFLMRKMQMIFQDPIASLNPRMTVKEIIAEGLRINGFRNEAEIDRRVKKALTTVGLVPEHASRYPHEFSGGQRQRIGIARALIVEPTLILADEPISALDVSIRAQVINLLNDLRHEQGITIMFIAHDLSVVKYFSDRVAVMYFGKIVEIGDKNKIFNNPLHPYTLSLIDAIPLPDPKYEQARGKLKRYNPAKQHNYTEQDPPRLREIEEDHVVLCNEEEYQRYKKQVSGK